jgi:hypothetical protein
MRYIISALICWMSIAGAAQEQLGQTISGNEGAALGISTSIN